MIDGLLKNVLAYLGLKSGTNGSRTTVKTPAKAQREDVQCSYLKIKLIFDLHSMVLDFQKHCGTLFTLFPGCQIRNDKSNQDNLGQAKSSRRMYVCMYVSLSLYDMKGWYV